MSGSSRGSSRGSSKGSTPSRQLSKMSLGTDSDLLPPTLRYSKDPGKPAAFPGSAGTPCKLAVNHFEITVAPNQKKIKDGVLFMYNITVVPPWQREYKRGDRPLYQRVIQKWKEEEPLLAKEQFNWVYDGGKIMYSTKYIQNTEKRSWTVKVKETMEAEQEREFTIKDFGMVKRIPVSQELAEWAAGGRSGGVPQDSIHLLDVLLSQAIALNLNYECIGRSYYFPTPGSVLDIGFGKEVWTGIFSSVRPYGWKDGKVLLTLNMDVSNKPATKELHLTKSQNSYIHQVLQSRRTPIDFSKGLQPDQVRELEKDIKGMKIRYELPNGSKRGYRVLKVLDSAAKLRIPDLDVTVMEYFKSQYKQALTFPNMPCLWLGSREKTIYIPVEFCSMTAQPLPRNKALQDDATAKMIRGTAVNPLDRQKKILAGLRENNQAFKNDPYAKEFGINVAGSMCQINGRILAPPSLEYTQARTNAKVKVDAIDSSKPGSWRQPNGMYYTEGKSVDLWAVVDLVGMGGGEYKCFVDSLKRSGRESGLLFNSEPIGEVVKQENVEKFFQNIVDDLKAKGKKLQLIVVVLPSKGGHVYDKVKHLGDVKHKVPTQCVIKKNLFKAGGANNQVLGNLCLKINSKLGGKNHTLHRDSRPDILKRPIMIMGADVTHPAPEHKGMKPSIAAVVGSVDPQATQYEVQVRVQNTEQNEEVIQDMKNVTIELLKRFKEKTTRKPERLVMFRDGVSEGQFLTVLAKELCAIRQACTELEPDYKPAITYVVVQKRHHTRFFPEDGHKYQKNNNALAGTVVDHGINHPTEGDFYLLSHEGIQGTSRPCHYQVLWDDSDMTADALETLAYYLCHLYSRARKHHNELINARETPAQVKKTIESSKINMMYFV